MKLSTNPKQLFTKYFKDNPTNMQALNAATFAYHMDCNSHKNAHYFKSGKLVYSRHNKIVVDNPTVCEYSFDNGVSWINYDREKVSNCDHFLLRNDHTDSHEYRTVISATRANGVVTFNRVNNNDRITQHTTTNGIDIFNEVAYNEFVSEQCYYCGRSRTEVRFGSEPPECKNLNISQTILDEELKTYALLNNSAELIPAILNKKFNSTLSADALIYLQTTAGISPDIVSTILNIDIECFMARYEELMCIHRSKSGNMFKGKHVINKTT